MRVLFVIPGDGAGSSMIFARRQAEHMRHLGVDADSLYLGDVTSPAGVYKAWQRLRHEVGKFRPDIIHAHYGTVTSFICAFGTRAPLVITFRGSDLNPEPAVNSVRVAFAHVLSQLSVLRAKRLICVSAELRRRLWWRRARVAVMPTGADFEIFRPRQKEDVRAELGWNDLDNVVIFNAGHDPVGKGLDLVTQAVALAEIDVGKIRLVVLDGNIAPRDVPLYFNASDCLVLASRYEGSPTVVQEALACNLPVVAVDVGDVAERLSGVSPSAVVRRCASDVADAIVEILRRGCRSNGRRLATDCSQIALAVATKELYEEVLFGSSRKRLCSTTFS